jgi:hypothetical protein
MGGGDCHDDQWWLSMPGEVTLVGQVWRSVWNLAPAETVGLSDWSSLPCQVAIEIQKSHFDCFNSKIFVKNLKKSKFHPPSTYKYPSHGASSFHTI